MPSRSVLSANPFREILNMSNECYAWKFRQLDRMLSRMYDTALRPHGITFAQLNLLVKMFIGGQCSRTAICTDLQVERSTLTRNLRPLLARKWLTLVPSESGARQDIAITEAGEAMVLEIKPTWKRAQRRVHKELGESVRSSLTEILALLHKLDHGERVQSSSGGRRV